MDQSAILPAVAARLARLFAPAPRNLVDFIADGAVVGALVPERASRLARFADVFALGERGLAFVEGLASHAVRTQALDHVARVLAAEGALTSWRDERYEIRAGPQRPPSFDLERAAARYFGVATQAVHVNGLVAAADGTRMWIARRSPAKAIDPGLLDNLVGGGIASGMGIADTLVKEAWEEAGIPATLASHARPAARLAIRRLQPDGVQHETIHAHDLWLPAGFVPANQDGEAVEHRLVPLAGVVRLLAQDTGPDEMTADASLVATDTLLRLGTIPPADPWRAPLERLCRAAG